MSERGTELSGLGLLKQVVLSHPDGAIGLLSIFAATNGNPDVALALLLSGAPVLGSMARSASATNKLEDLRAQVAQNRARFAAALDELGERVGHASRSQIQNSEDLRVELLGALDVLDDKVKRKIEGLLETEAHQRALEAFILEVLAENQRKAWPAKSAGYASFIVQAAVTEGTAHDYLRQLRRVYDDLDSVHVRVLGVIQRAQKAVEEMGQKLSGESGPRDFSIELPEHGGRWKVDSYFPPRWEAEHGRILACFDEMGVSTSTQLSPPYVAQILRFLSSHDLVRVRVGGLNSGARPTRWYPGPLLADFVRYIVAAESKQ